MLQPIIVLFLTQLAYVLLNSIWQIATIWGLYKFLTFIIQLKSNQKYLLLIFSQLIGFLFIITNNFFLKQENFEVTTYNVSQLGIIDLLLKSILPYLSIIYLATIVVLFSKWLFALFALNRLRKNGLTKMEGEWRIFTQEKAALLGIKQKVQIFLSSKVDTPLTFGFFKPIILIPLAAINQLTTYQLESIILHELAHIKRADYLVQMILSIIQKIFFFNPFVQLLHKEIEKERENSCDDWVLQFRYDGLEYSQALLKLAKLQLSPILAMKLIGNEQNLLQRIERINGKTRKNKRNAWMLISFLTFSFLLILGSIIFYPNTANKSIDQQNLNNKKPNTHFKVNENTSGFGDIIFRPIVNNNTKKKKNFLSKIQINTKQTIAAKPKKELKTADFRYETIEVNEADQIIEPPIATQPQVSKTVKNKTTEAKNIGLIDNEAIPILNALKIDASSEDAQINEEIIDKEKVTVIKIKTKKAADEQTSTAPKYYRIVVSNNNQPDKKYLIILE